MSSSIYWYLPGNTLLNNGFLYQVLCQLRIELEFGSASLACAIYIMSSTIPQTTGVASEWGGGLGRLTTNTFWASLRFNQNYNFKLLSSDSSLNHRVAC